MTDYRIPRLTIMGAAVAHPMDHYGQLVEYLRMNGIDPQAQRAAARRENGILVKIHEAPLRQAKSCSK